MEAACGCAPELAASAGRCNSDWPPSLLASHSSRFRARRLDVIDFIVAAVQFEVAGNACHLYADICHLKGKVAAALGR